MLPEAPRLTAHFPPSSESDGLDLGLRRTHRVVPEFLPSASRYDQVVIF